MKIKRNPVRIWLPHMAMLVLFGTACLAAPTYSLTPLGILPGYVESDAVAVNNAGQVAGTLTDSNGRSHAFIYSGGTMTVLGLPAGFVESEVVGINNSGEIAGNMGDGTGGWAAFLYSNGSVLNYGYGTSAAAINDAGQVVGLNNGLAYILPGTYLGTVSGYNDSEASAINNSNQVVLGEENGSFLWELFLDTSGTLKDLGITGTVGAGGGAGAGGPAINNSGQIIGTLSSNGDPFLYSNGTVTDLGFVLGSDYDATLYAINDSGQIVGVSDSSAFVYISGTRYFLGNLSISGGGSSDWDFLTAQGINDSGQIVGQVASADLNVDGEAYLLTPTSSTYTITVSALPSNGGTVNGGGTFAAGASKTVTATASGGFVFTNWTENGTVVSTTASYTFTLNASCNLVANFIDTSIPNWVETSAPYNSWYAIASSADGMRLVAVVGGPDTSGPIEISPDAGTTWIQTSAPSEVWFSVACSANGSNIVAVSQEDQSGNGGQIYISTNFGATWTLTSAPTGSWDSVASSADGTKLVALGGGAIYTSTNSGATWIPGGSGSGWQYSVASSTNGTKLVAVNNGQNNEYRVYTSTNSGSTWIKSGAPNGVPFSPWYSVTSSADGTKLVAGMENGGLYISANSGATWTLTSTPTNETWEGIASSADGSKLVALFNYTTIYSSTDSGVTWVVDPVPDGGLTPGWTGVASSADGKRLAAVAENGSIWVSEPPPGYLNVTIEPSGVITAGAQWQVDGSAFYNSGATDTSLSVGAHTLSFKPISGWITPSNQTVNISSAVTTTASGFYIVPKPTLSITNVLIGLQVSNANFIVEGTATDNVPVVNIYCQLNGMGWVSPTSFNGSNWSDQLLLEPGTNQFQAYAMDSSGYISATNMVNIVYVLSAPLSVSTNGAGSLSPNDNGALLQIGKSYSITATPVAGAGFEFTNWTGGTSLPLSFITNGTTLQFLMVSNLMLQANFVDTNRPLLSITNVTAGMLVSNPVFTVKGTAKDKVAVSDVLVSLNNGVWNPAGSGNGWSNWLAQVTLIPGTNTIAAYAVDTNGNVSSTSTDKLVYIVATTLTVRTNGDGGISPAYNGATLQVGASYSMAATAKTGSVFTNWTDGLGNIITNGATLKFVMTSNLIFIANIVEVTKPALTITTPTNLQRMTNALASVKGTASDNWQVSKVLYQLNNGAWSLPTTTNGWTNWSVTLPLVLGTNKLNAYAMNLAGILSTTSSVSVISSNTFQLLLAFTDEVPLKTNGLGFTLQLSTGLDGHIQVSTNLTSWATLTNFVGTNSTITFRDSAATNFGHRYYRAAIP